MPKRVFQIDLVNQQGRHLRRFRKKCYRAATPAVTQRALDRHPEAVSAVAEEVGGCAVIAAYR